MSDEELKFMNYCISLLTLLGTKCTITNINLTTTLCEFDIDPTKVQTFKQINFGQYKSFAIDKDAFFTIQIVYG